MFRIILWRFFSGARLDGRWRPGDLPDIGTGKRKTWHGRNAKRLKKASRRNTIFWSLVVIGYGLHVEFWLTVFLIGTTIPFALFLAGRWLLRSTTRPVKIIQDDQVEYYRVWQPFIARKLQAVKNKVRPPVAVQNMDPDTRKAVEAQLEIEGERPSQVNWIYERPGK